MLISFGFSGFLDSWFFFGWFGLVFLGFHSFIHSVGLSSEHWIL